MATSNETGSGPAAKSADASSLSAEHHTTLSKGSGISEEVIRLRGYKTIANPSELVSLGFTRQQARVPGLLLPVHCTDGSNGPAVYRPDAPRSVENRRKRDSDGTFKQHVIKYEMPKGAAVRLDCPALARAQLADPNVPLWVTEGQKKADCMVSRGLCTIALLGVWNWKGKNSLGGITFLADWDHVALNGRDVQVVFDSDLMSKHGVRQALERLTEQLQRKGAHVTQVYLPPGANGKVGVDDYLVEHTVEDLERLVEAPRPQPRAAGPQIQLLDAPPPTMRRPLAVIERRAYAAVWPHVQETATESEDREGRIVRHDPPIVRRGQQLFIVRDDGVIFKPDGSPFNPCESATNLTFDIRLPEKPEARHLWSRAGFEAYRAGKFAAASNVFNRLVDVVDRFIDFDKSLADQRTMCELVACYVLATWFLDAFNVIGYLWPNGERGSGKTQFLLVVADLSYLGQVILAGGSYACLRDLADYGATLAFDDAENLSDARRTDPDKRTLLLSGNRRGSTVPLKEPKGDRTWRTRYVNTFCPRLFSATRLPDPILGSRSIVVPLVRTPDRLRANSDPSDHRLWPHERSRLIDDLWALSLRNLTKLIDYESQVNASARLTGRNLEPWKATLAIAAWLQDQGVDGLQRRIESVSVAYQTERQEMETSDLAVVVIRALCKSLGCDISDIKAINDINMRRVAGTFGTTQIASTAQEIAQAMELDLDLAKITSRRVGHAMGKMRFKKAREAGTGGRQWQVEGKDVYRWLVTLGLHTPDAPEEAISRTPAETDPLDVTNVEIVTNVKDERPGKHDGTSKSRNYSPGDTASEAGISASSLMQASLFTIDEAAIPTSGNHGVDSCRSSSWEHRRTEADPERTTIPFEPLAQTSEARDKDVVEL